MSKADDAAIVEARASTRGVQSVSVRPADGGPGVQHDSLVPHAAAYNLAAERDPHGIDPKTGGAKLDADKIDYYSLFLDYFPRAVTAVAYVSEYGARKYHLKGWEKVPNGYVRYSAADVRHIMKEMMGEQFDDSDSGLSHAAQHAWNAMARLELALQAGTTQCVRGNELVGGKPVLGTSKVVDLPLK